MIRIKFTVEWNYINRGVYRVRVRVPPATFWPAAALPHVRHYPQQ